MKKRIIIVDDDEFIGDVMQTILEEDGHEVVVYRDDNFLESENHADIIFLDLWLNGLDGQEVFENIKKHLHLNTCKIILVSAASDLIPIANKLKLSYIAKPFDIEDLLKSVA